MKVRIYQLSILIVLLLVWQYLATYVAERGVFFYGSPQTVGHCLYDKIRDGSILVDTWVTAVQVLVGFCLGNLLGVVFGLSLWFSRTVAAVARPYIVVIGSIPILALSPILIIWFGIGFESKVAIVTLATLVVATVQAFEGARQADPDLERLLFSFGATRSQVFRRVIVPSSVSWVISGFRLNIGFALLGSFIGEFISAERGLGHLIVQAMGLFNTPMVLAGVVMFSALALLLSLMVNWVEHRLVPWKFDDIGSDQSRPGVENQKVVIR
jgi:NitT/TauT family transport system permease protein